MVKSFDDLTIVDDFIFCTVMEDPKLCKELLTMLLKDKIGKITKLFKQKPIETQIASKGVRLDIMIEDEQGKLYDVEMPFSARHPMSGRKHRVLRFAKHRFCSEALPSLAKDTHYLNV